MKKVKMMMVIVLATFMVMPAVFALDNITTYGEVTDITGTSGKHTDNYKAPKKQADENNKTTTFDITEGELEVIDKTAAAGIPDEYDDSTLFGIAVKAPTPSTGLEKACWVRPGETTCKADSDAIVDGPEGTYTLWISFKASELKAAIEADGENAVIEKTVKLQWGGKDDNNNVQTIIVRLHAANVTLKNDPTASDTIAEGSEFTEEDKVEAIAVYNETHPKTTAEEQKQEANPNTSDINLYLLLSLIAVSGCGIAYTVKRRFN